MSKTLDYYSTDSLLNNEILIAIITMFIGYILFLAFLVKVFLPFKEEKKRIKMEIRRSFEEDEEEYLYWKNELKRLYMSLIPIIGKFFK